MTQYVYSTLTADNEYCEYVKAGEGQRVQHSVTIAGGHGVMNKNFITPLGVVTEVSDEDMEFLLANSAFQFHMKGGFVSVDKKKVDPEKVAANLKPRDKSAQLTPADFPAEEQPK